MDVGNGATIVGTNAGLLELLVLGDHTHIDVAREVKETVGNLAHLVSGSLSIGNRVGGIHLGHVGVDLRPFLSVSRLDIDVVVVLQRSPGGSRIGEDLMKLLPLSNPRNDKFI